MIRKAVLADVSALVRLEEACFQHDRISPRSFKNFISKSSATLLVDDGGPEGAIRAYSLVLFHTNTSLARLYSIAVSPDLRGQKLSKILMDAAEADVLAKGVTRLRLEVHQSNEVAQKLYRDRGYKTFAISPDYYEDHGTALRMEKLLAPRLVQNVNNVPYYAQTLDFTCGPSCLIMAMMRHNPDLYVDRVLELQLWREATTIFMTTGLGGCGPLGLALAAWRRGYRVELAVSNETEIFVDSVRSETKKDVIRLVEEGFMRDVAQTDIVQHKRPFSIEDYCRHLAKGGVPIVLISAYRLTGDKALHWVTVTACDDRFIYINDPFTEEEKGRTDTDCLGIPLTPREFDRMSRFGKHKHYAALVIYPQGKE